MRMLREGTFKNRRIERNIIFLFVENRLRSWNLLIILIACLVCFCLQLHLWIKLSSRNVISLAREVNKFVKSIRSSSFRFFPPATKLVRVETIITGKKIWARSWHQRWLHCPPRWLETIVPPVKQTLGGDVGTRQKNPAILKQTLRNSVARLCVPRTSPLKFDSGTSRSSRIILKEGAQKPG